MSRIAEIAAAVRVAATGTDFRSGCRRRAGLCGRAEGVLVGEARLSLAIAVCAGAEETRPG